MGVFGLPLEIKLPIPIFVQRSDIFYAVPIRSSAIFRLIKKTIDDDLFDILDRLKETNAVLVIETYVPELVGIVTSYDTTEYFRNRTEDLMRVEDIELMVKEFIKTAYVDENGELDEAKLNSAVAQVTAYKKANDQSERSLSFDFATGQK